MIQNGCLQPEVIYPGFTVNKMHANPDFASPAKNSLMMHFKFIWLSIGQGSVAVKLQI